MARLARITLRHGQYQQQCTAIVGKRGRKFTPLVTVEFPIRLRKVSNGEVDRSIKELRGSLAKAVKRYRKIGRRHGITKGAIRFLRGVSA